MALSSVSRGTLERWILREQALLPAPLRDAEFAWLEDVVAAVRRVAGASRPGPRRLYERVREQLNCSRELLHRLGRLLRAARLLHERNRDLIVEARRAAGAA